MLFRSLVSKFGNGEANDSKGWFWTIVLFAGISVVLLVIAFFSSKERISPPKDQKNNLKQDLKDLLASTPWKAMFTLTLFLFVTLALFGSAMSYYFNYYVDKQALHNFLNNYGLVAQGEMTLWHRFLDMFGLISKPDLSNVFAVGYSFFNMIGQLITLAGVLLLSQPLSMRFGKKTVFILCLGLTALFTAMFYFVDPDQIGLIFIINILKNAAYAPTIPLLWAMMGDVADFNEWKHYRRATGFTFAGIVFALKAGLGVGGAICGIIIESFGFVANTDQTASSILGIRLTSSLIPAITFAIGTIALFFYPITKQLNFKMQKELDEIGRASCRERV